MPDTLIKLSADISELKGNLTEITNRLDKIDTAVKRTGQTMSDSFQKTANRQQKRIDNWRTELGLIEKLEADIKRWAAAAKRATNTRDLERYNRNIAKATVELKKLGTVGVASLTKVNRSVSVSTQLFNRLRITMATTFGAFGAIRVLRGAADAMLDFEKGMASVRAITNATSEEFNQLSAIAIRASNSGIFSATNIAELEVKLAKLGFTIGEIASMTDGIVALATATGEDLGKAAELTASTIRGLGLNAVETGMVIDQLGKSFVSSGLDINKYRESIKFIAPIAKDMGIELSAIVGILGKLADRQIFGSLAGTALRRVLIRLADSSSNLSKKVGFTVESGEDLINAFIKLKEEGTTFEELLKLVDVRSLTATSALIDNAEALKEYVGEIDNANGVIDEMANVQLETLNSKLLNLEQRWKNLIIVITGENKSGESVFENLLGTLVDTGAEVLKSFTFLFSLMGDGEDILANMAELEKERLKLINEQKELTSLNNEELENRIMLLEDEIFILEKVVSVKQTATEEDLKRLVLAKELLDFAKDLRKQTSTDDFFSLETLINDLSLLKEEQSKVNLAAKNGTEIFNAYSKEIAELQKRINELRGKTDKSSVNNQKNTIKNIFDLEVLRANAIEDEFDRNSALAKAKAKFTIDNLVFSTLTETQKAEKIKLINEQLKKDLENIENKRIENVIAVSEKELAAIQKLEREKFAARAETMKAEGVPEEEIRRRQIELEMKLLKVRILNLKALGGDPALIAQLSAELDTLGESLDNVVGGGEKDPIDKWTKFLRDFKKVANALGISVKSIADAFVNAANREVDALNTAFAEKQRALQAEIALNEQGLASNVALRQKELEDIDAKRKEALKQQEKALKIQSAIESAQQAIQLTTAVASLFKSGTGLFGVFGIAPALAAIGGMYAAFQALKKKATEVTKFEKGGWEILSGERHSGGGISLGDGREGEDGEIMSVFNRGAVRKNKKLITSFTDAVNNGTKIDLDHTLNNRIGSQDINVNSQVSLDKSSQIKEMNGLLKKNLRRNEVYQMGNGRIEKSGTRTRIIHG